MWLFNMATFGYGELEMPWDDSGFFVVSGSVTSELEVDGSELPLRMSLWRRSLRHSEEIRD